MLLTQFLTDHGEAIVAATINEIAEASLRHYDADGPEAVGERFGAIFEHTLSCVRDGVPDALIAHATNVARERFDAGYDLYELQTGINIFEEVCWQRLLPVLDPPQFIFAIGRLSTALEACKDTMARTYVSLTAASQGAHADDRTPETDLA